MTGYDVRIDSALEEIEEALDTYPFDQLDDIRTLDDVRRRVNGMIDEVQRVPISWEELAALAVVGRARGL